MNEGSGVKTGSGQVQNMVFKDTFWGGKGGVKSLRARQGGTFLRDHSIPRERREGVTF